MKDFMPAKMLSSKTVYSLVNERLVTWGYTIRTQRVRQRISAEQLCDRTQISRATLSRIERGDSAVNVAAYMTALLVLGIFDEATPALDSSLWSSDEKGRVKVRRSENDDDYF
jgi:transcriptional regulator with XRE-family HTH domain